MARGNIGGQRPAFGSAARKAQDRAASVGGLKVTGGPIAAANGSSAVFTPSIAGGRAPFTLSLAGGSLPSGRALSGLSETGTYTAVGTFNYTLQVSDGTGAVRRLAVTATIS